MKTEDKYPDVLQSLEHTVVRFWNENPDLTDYPVQRAYEAACRRYRAEAAGRTSKPPELTGLDLTLYEALVHVCEWRLGRRAHDDEPETRSPAPLRTDELLECLQRLVKSVDRWNRAGGRRGYLEFVSQYIA
jgi:hypothetical protein